MLHGLVQEISKYLPFHTYHIYLGERRVHLVNGKSNGIEFPKKAHVNFSENAFFLSKTLDFVRKLGKDQSVHVQKLDLSGEEFGCLDEARIPVFTEVLRLDENTEMVILRDIHMLPVLFQHFVLQFRKCRNLKKLALDHLLMDDDHDDVIHRMFSDHPGLPLLTELTLNRMIVRDVMTLSDVLHNILSTLRLLNLSV